MELLRAGCFSSQNAASQLLLIGYLALTFTLTLTQVFTPQAAKAILKSHNEYRRQESASDMYLLHWNVSLQQRADSWAHRCLFKHERNLDLGENLYFDTDYENGVFERGIEGWHKEKSNWGYTDQSCTGTCHFTQLVWAYTTTIGCSAHVCPALNVAGRIVEDAMFLVCYYYPRGNFAGHFPYSRGRPCSECAPGDTCSNNLCVSSGPESKLAPEFVKMLVPQTPVRLSRVSTSMEAFKSLIQNFGSVNLAQPYQQRAHHVERHHHHRQQHHYQSETVIQSSSASASASSSSSSSSSRTHLTHIRHGGKEHHPQLHHISQQHYQQHSAVLQQHNRERQWVTELEQERRKQQKEREEEEERRRQQELEERQRQQAREEQERRERMMEQERREEEERRRKMLEEQQRLQEEQRIQQELAEKRQKEEQERLQMLEEMRKKQQEELEQRRQLLEEQRREQERLEEQSRTQHQHRQQHHHHHQQGLTYNQDRDLVLSRNQESTDRSEGNVEISLQRPTDRSDDTTTERFDISPVRNLQTHHHINRELETGRHETHRISSSNRESRLTSSRQTIRTQGIHRGEDQRGRYGVAHQRSTQSNDDSTSTSTVGTVVNILSRGEIDRRKGGSGYETVSRPYNYGQVHRSGSSVGDQVKTYKHHSYAVGSSYDSKAHTSTKAEENETSENESKEDHRNNRRKKWLKRWQNRMNRKKIDADSHRHKHSYVMESDGRRCVDRHPSCDQWAAKCHRSAAVTIACPLTCGKCGKNLLLSQAQGDQPARSSYHSYHMRSNLQSYHRVEETHGESKRERKRKRRLSAEERRRRRLERRRLRAQGAPMAIRAPPDSTKQLQRLSRRRSKAQRRHNLAIQREERREARRRHKQARPGLCRDDPKHIKSCKYWAKKGFCADNRLIKTIFCQLSCGHCSS